MYERVRDPAGGNAFTAFRIWGPGKTAKLQCDFSANISPRMFRTFVSPYLAEQCAWLDYSLYHLDGTTALQHLEPLLEIAELDAIEWTPQAGRPGGGSPEWYDLYRRIRAAGKGVQAVGVALHEVIPLLDAVGPAGMCIVIGDDAYDEAAAERLLKALEPYR
ncbi:MAG: cobalamin-binding protein, partial [Anaerolineae bacterium]|nr:cobalamin-binding protein [Anaerolineae bacterium]